MTTDIRRGDWRDVLPGTYDPAHAVVVTDPPYGLDTADDGKGYADTIPWAEHVRSVLELLPAKRHVIRGPATALIGRDYPQPRRLCVEVAAFRRRAAHRPGVVPYLWQGWAVYGRLKVDRHVEPPHGDGLALSSMYQSADVIHTRRTAHRAMTPYPSAYWIIGEWADPGDVVIDPYAGMGTIGQAARARGFDYIGAELVPEYADVAEEGLSMERLTMGLVG